MLSDVYNELVNVLHATQLFFNVDKAIHHSLDCLLVQLHLNASDACAQQSTLRFAFFHKRTELTSNPTDLGRRILQSDLANNLQNHHRQVEFWHISSNSKKCGAPWGELAETSNSKTQSHQRASLRQ
jgi:hypothetical protein